MPVPTDRLSIALGDRYRLDRRIGEGGMATVYLAHDVKHARQVAVKVLRPELVAVLGPERFLQEIRTTANLQHPNILPLFDSGQAGGFLYYVMPFVEGETLRQRLDRDIQLGIDEAVGLAREVADALDYAHRHEVIHRDIKPENILLHDGRPVVADFGIALAVSAAGGGRLTETGLSLGTPHYMSPEQATAEKDLTPRSDVYSLGCVLYEMLTGEPPHTGATAQQVIMKIVTDDPRPVTDLRKAVPPHVAHATARALERLPADRFATAAEFAAALDDPGFAPTVPMTGTALPGRAAGRWMWPAAALVAAGLAAVGWLRSPEGGDLGIGRFNIVLPEEDDFARQGGTIALSPDGMSIVYVGPGAEGVQLWHKRRDELHATPIPGTEGAFVPFFSPEGDRVGFYVAPRTIRAVSLTGAPPITISESTWGGGMEWVDGHVYSHGLSRGIVRIPEGGGLPEPVTRVDSAAGETSHYRSRLLPGGRRLLHVVRRGDLVSAPEDWDVAVTDLQTGDRQILVRAVAAEYVSTGHLVFVRVDGSLLAAPFDPERGQLTGASVPLFDGVRVKQGGFVDLALSADGSLLYVAGELATDQFGRGQFVWVSRQGEVRAVDPGWSFGIPRNRSLVLSPDGSRIAYDALDETADVWIKQLDGGPHSRLTFEGSQNTGIAWRGNGTITFTSYRGDHSAVYARRVDGTGTADSVLRLEAPIWDGTWSPDGSWFVFRTGETLNARDMWAIRPGVDSVPRPLLQSGFDELFPQVSPDGRWLSYSSNESGVHEVFVRPFPEVESGRVQVSTAGGRMARWSRTGRELFYINGNDDLVAVRVRMSPTFAAGVETPLFSVADFVDAVSRTYYDVAPNGQRFLMVRRFEEADTARARLVMVQNFFEELRAKVPR